MKTSSPNFYKMYSAGQGMTCDAKLERLTCFDWFMLGKEQELDEFAEVWGWGWRGREVKKEQKEGVRNIWRVNSKRNPPKSGLCGLRM